MVSARFEFRFESLKRISVLILFVVYKLMIERSKYKRENYPRNAFEHKKEEPGLSTDQPSNNWALMTRERESIIDNTFLVIFAGTALKLFNF